MHHQSVTHPLPFLSHVSSLPGISKKMTPGVSDNELLIFTLGASFILILQPSSKNQREETKVGNLER